MKRIIGKTDAVIILVLTATALLIFLAGKTSPQAQTADIIIDDTYFCTIDLQDVQEPYQMTLPSQVVVSVDKGSIRVESSVCKDKLCVHSGTLSKDGDISACLPQKTLIKVSGTKKTDSPDAITY